MLEYLVKAANDDFRNFPDASQGVTKGHMCKPKHDKTDRHGLTPL